MAKVNIEQAEQAIMPTSPYLLPCGTLSKSAKMSDTYFLTLDASLLMDLMGREGKLVLNLGSLRLAPRAGDAIPLPRGSKVTITQE